MTWAQCLLIVQQFVLCLVSGYAQMVLSTQVTAEKICADGLPENKANGQAETDEEIPWAPIYHKAREVMGMSDTEFWNTSPRKYFALLDEALVFRGIKNEEKQEFMDDLF